MALPGEKLQLQKTVHSSLYSLESACWLRTTLTLTNYRLILSIDGPAAGIDPSLISSEEYKKQQRISKLKTKLGRNSISVCAILDSKEAESVDPAERRKIKKLQDMMGRNRLSVVKKISNATAMGNMNEEEVKTVKKMKEKFDRTSFSIIKQMEATKRNSSHHSNSNSKEEGKDAISRNSEEEGEEEVTEENEVRQFDKNRFSLIEELEDRGSLSMDQLVTDPAIRRANEEAMVLDREGTEGNVDEDDVDSIESSVGSGSDQERTEDDVVEENFTYLDEIAGQEDGIDDREEIDAVLASRVLLDQPLGLIYRAKLISPASRIISELVALASPSSEKGKTQRLLPEIEFNGFHLPPTTKGYKWMKLKCKDSMTVWMVLASSDVSSGTEIPTVHAYNDQMTRLLQTITTACFPNMVFFAHRHALALNKEEEQKKAEQKAATKWYEVDNTQHDASAATTENTSRLHQSRSSILFTIHQATAEEHGFVSVHPEDAAMQVNATSPSSRQQPAVCTSPSGGGGGGGKSTASSNVSSKDPSPSKSKSTAGISHRELAAAGNTPPLFPFHLLTEVQRAGIPAVTRITHVNAGFQLCSSYPEILLVPAGITDEQLGDIAEYRSRGRIPAITYMHPNSRPVLLARAAQPKLGPLFKSCAADIAYLQALALSGEPLRSREQGGGLTIIDARSKTAVYLNQLFRSGGAESAAAVRRGLEKEAVRAAGGEFGQPFQVKFCRIVNIHAVRKAMTHLRTKLRSQVDVSPSPTAAAATAVAVAHMTGKNTPWLAHLTTLLQGANNIVEHLSKRSVSVLLHCSDGWDRTAQLSSLAKLLLHPYYRTHAGFASLIHLEWLLFGHQFAKRCGHGSSLHKDHDCSPIFVQFIDAVWQLTAQCPRAFEFNEHYLLALCQHVYACRFTTFLEDSQQAREEKCRQVSQGHVADFFAFAHDEKQLPAFCNPTYIGRCAEFVAPPFLPVSSSTSSSSSSSSSPAAPWATMPRIECEPLIANLEEIKLWTGYHLAPYRQMLAMRAIAEKVCRSFRPLN